MDPVRGSVAIFHHSLRSDHDRFERMARHFREDENGLSHIIEFSLALILILITLAGFFTAVDSEFILHTPDDNKRQDECIRYTHLLVGDTGSARLNGNDTTTRWETLNASVLDNDLIRPGFAQENESYGVISHHKVAGLRNLTYKDMLSILSIRKYQLNIEVSEVDGAVIASFGYSHDVASKVSETNRVLVMAGDGDLRPVKFTFRLFEGIKRRALVRVNELMYQPEDGKNEWIELYNPTDEAVNLSSFALYFQAGQTFRDSLVGDSLILPGHSYGLIIDRDETWTQYPIAPGTVRFLVKDGNFGKVGLSDDDMNFFFQGETFVGMTYSYTSEPGGNGNGNTLEWSVTQQDWVESLVSNGTPGSENSIV